MATKPTTQMIRERAEFRMREIGYHKPQSGEPSFAEKRAIYQRRLDNQILDAEAFLTRIYASELDRERQAADADAKALDELTGKLKASYLSQPGATESDFQKALPRLLERHREDATFNGPTRLERQVAGMRQRLGRF